MAKQPENHNTSWTPADIQQLRKLAEENTPTRVIGIKMGRTEGAIQNKSSEEGVSLKPTNQSPCNRGQK